MRERARVAVPSGVPLLFRAGGRGRGLEPGLAGRLAAPLRRTARTGSHPSGRAERAARHGRPLDPADLPAEENLRPALRAADGTLTCYEDTAHHFPARAVRDTP
ncbi:hypothetical protein ABZT34_11555 [Streptomyces sp. NPDC005329]|uniref:hypothetical protein n=1 Tax=Streptomyces sp. NPDC005329 TaxID=3157034 RepID=UPI0033A4BD92